jgi:acylphosphatase
MNILDYKRKALGYSFREGGDEQNYPTPAAAATPDYSQPGWTYGGPQQGWSYNPAVGARAAATSAVVAPPIVATSGPSAGQTLAPVISTTGGGGPNVDIPITASLEAYESVNPDGTVNRYDTQGNFVTTYTSNGSDIVGDFFAGIDSSLGLSKGLTAIGGGLADLDSALGLSKNAPAIVGLAASYFLPGIGQALGQSLVNAGVLTGAAATPAMATTIGTALAQTGVSVAQGKSLDEALTSAIISVGTAGLTQAFGADVKSAISNITDNPIAQKAIFKAGTDVVTAVAQGKSGDEVLQGIGRSVVSTVAGAAANEIVNNIPGVENLSDAAKKVVTSGIATTIQGGDGTKSMLNTALREGTTYVRDTLTATPGADAANPMSQDPAQRAGADTVTGGATLDDVESTLAANGLQNTGAGTGSDEVTPTGTAGTTGAMQGGFGSGNTTADTINTLTNNGLQENADIVGSEGTGSDVNTAAGQQTIGGVGSTTGVDTINTLTNNGLQETTPDVITGIGTSDTSNVATGTETLASQTGTKLKTSDGEDVKLTDAQLDALVQKQLVFEGGDYNTKQDAANEAKLAGYTQFEYDGSVYTMQPNGPTERALFQTLIDEAPTQNSAFNVARKLLGTETTFSYNGKELTTVTADEQNAKMQEAAYNDPTRALDNFYSGNIRYAGYDVQGDVAGKTKLSAPAQSVLDQLIATGAQGIGEQLQTFAAGVSLSTGTSLDTAASRLGDFLVQYGKDKDGTDVAKQTEALKSDWANAGKLSFFDQPGAIAAAIKENPLGFVSLVGQEFVQEGLPWIAGSVAGATALAFGAPVAAGLTTAAVVSSVLDGWESFGAGGKEAYELLKKAGVPDDVARDKAIANGALHAAVTIPAEYLADKSLFKHYFDGLKGGVKEYAAKYGSTIGVNAASEFIETIPQNLSTTYTVNGKITAKDMQSATAGAWAAASIGAGVATGAISPAAINEAVSIGKDYAGNDVSFGDFISGKKTVDLSTLKSDAALGADASGNQFTLGNALVDNDYLRIDPNFIDDFLPTAFVDPFVTDATEAREIARELGYTNPSQQVLDSLVGPKTEAEARTELDTFLESMSSFEAGKPVTAAAAQEIMADLGLTNMSDADAISLANQIVQSVPDDKLAPPADDFLDKPGVVNEDATDVKSKDDFLDKPGVTTEASPVITSAEVSKIVTDALAANPSLTPDQVTNIVNDAVKTIPLGTTAADVQKIVDTAVKTIPTGPSAQDVSKIVTDALAANPSLTEAQVTKVVNDAIAKVPAGVSTADVSNAINTAIANIPAGLSTEDVSKVVTDATKDLATKEGVGTAITGATKDLATTKSVDDLKGDLTKAIDDAGKNNADAFDAIDKVIADLKAAGLTEQQVQDAVDLSVGGATKTLQDAIDAAVTGNTKALDDLKTLVAKDIGASETKVTNVVADAENRLGEAIQAAKDLGLKGDAALQAGLDTVAADLGTTKEALLTQLGKTEASLKTQFATDVGVVAKSVENLSKTLTDSIAANEKAGLTRDEATKKSVDALATELGTTKADLLAQLGTTEEALGKKVEAVAEDLGGKLNAQGKLFMESLVQQGMDQQQALETAIAAQTKLVTEGQTATQKALGELSTAQQQEVADRVAAGEATDAAIAAVKATVETGQEATQKALSELSEAQQKEVADRVKAGEATDAAIAAVQESVTTGQKATEEKLDAQGKAFMDALVAQGMDQQTALETAIAAQTKLVTEGQNATNLRIDELVNQGMTYQQATQKAITEMSTGFTTQLTDAEKARQEQASAWDKQREADLIEAEKQRGIDRQAELDRAAEVEKARQTEITNQKAREAANLKTIQTGQLRGQMQTGLQGLIGGLQQQATQMAAPGVVETVKSTPGFDFGSPLNVGFFGGYESQKTPPKDKESLKIATGGYLDDLLEAIR